MDNSILAEQRRETVINLLKSMKIKKTDGDGFDKDDVYVCMQQLCDVYEKSIEDLTASYDEQIAELQDKYQKYEENNDLYISLIMEAKKSSNEIISKAKAEVDEILANGKEEIAKQEEELQFARMAAEQEKANLKAGTDRAREEAEASRAVVAAEVEEERKQAEIAIQKYKQRVEAMEQEFEEIKTNILRTAGKIDGLKVQINDKDTDCEWKINDTDGRIDMPEPDIAIEETTQVAAPLSAPETEPEGGAGSDVGGSDRPAMPEEELTFEELVAKLQSEDAKADDGETAGEITDIPEITEIPEDSVTVDAGEITLPDMKADADVEISLDDIPKIPAEGEISLEGITETAAEAEETPIEEISFEGLEELFKE